MNVSKNPITVKLVDRLSVFLRDADVSFGDGLDALTFYRFKMRSEKFVQLEFNEKVYRDRSGELIDEDV